MPKKCPVCSSKVEKREEEDRKAKADMKKVIARAMTDATTKALSKLGYNADVFLGKFDDNKYVQEQAASHRNEHRPATAADANGPSGQPADANIATAAQIKKLNAAGATGYNDAWDENRAKLCLWATNGRTESAKELSKDEATQIIDHIQGAA